MTNPHGSEPDPEPDKVALDELSQAFADGTAADGLDEILIVEQDPLPEPDTPEDELDPTARDDSGAGSEGVAPGPVDEPVVEAAAPRIIKIGSFDGDVEIVEPGVDSSGVGETTVGEPVVIEIDDEDMPDPIYVEGSLDRDGSRTIVFIEDDDTADALKPESERDLRRGIEPRMRERRVAIRRAQGRKRLKWVVLGVFVLLLVVGALATLGSSIFGVTEDGVEITGTVYTDPDELQAVIDDVVGTPVLLIDTQDVERRLEEIPWVAASRVSASFPHGLTIEIREREAITTYQGPDGRFRVLDREGRVLDVLDLYPLAYVLIGGPDPVDLEAGEFAPRGYAAASELAKNLTGSVRGQVEIIEVAADGSRLILRLDDGTEVRFGEARDLFAKLVRLETVLASTEERTPGVIDVSTRDVILPSD